MAAHSMKHMTTTPSAVRAAVYLRISSDPERTGLANERQREDCLRILHDRGWELFRVYEDTESASDRRKVRHGYEAMLKDYTTGAFDALICWDLDRLTRQPRQLEDWIEAAEDAGLILVTANGEADLQTDGGRMYARIKASVARAEVERKSARQRRQMKQAADKGKPTWANRPFGYNMDGTIREEEAELVRQAYRDVLRGTTPTEIGRRWGEAGFLPTIKAKAWTGGKVSDILKSPRNIAQSTYKGEVVGPAQWPALIDVQTWEAVHAILTSPTRGGNRTPRKGKAGREPSTLLTGIVSCAACGGGVVRTLGQVRKDGTRRVMYACHEDHATADMVWLESTVFLVFLMALRHAREAWPGADDSEVGRKVDAARAELATIEAKLAELGEAYASDALTLEQLTTATATLRRRQEAARVRLANASATPTLDSLLAPGAAEAMIEAWFELDLGPRRAAISSLFREIKLFPRGRAGKGKVPELHFDTVRPLPGFPARVVGLSSVTSAELAQFNLAATTRGVIALEPIEAPVGGVQP